ncbi:kinase-like domain-containing protein [Dendryphion nanum]|uniref:EKC/KEOPS complex subunit BUD32 n=1 Tax=Dendryphion nanum TaxID=256645 RepID=A0A9P9DAI1_9PLEO|nr:kinase-like domain-containing protein [Dendryphion nanum]
MPPTNENQEVEHFDFDKEKGPTIRYVDKINKGGEAVIDEVEVQDTFRNAPFVCVRRSYNFQANRHSFQSLKIAHVKEVSILKKLKNQRHFIELLGSYTRDSENTNDLALVILQNPRANCDLASLLNNTPEGRQAIISDTNLERGIACLASALHFLHSIHIRHKDIASKNILVHGNQLLFADFGLSIDFSELTNSATCSLVRQQGTYRPPEGDSLKQHTCASDVFSLGCVFFEILTTLSCTNTNFQEKKKSERKEKYEYEKELQDIRPYRYHLKQVYRWLENKRNDEVTNERQASTRRYFWLKKTEQMLAIPPGQRPRMFNIILELKRESERHREEFAGTACEFCQDRMVTLDTRVIDEPINVDFEEGFNNSALINENSATGLISPGSPQTFSRLINAWTSGWIASIPIDLGIIKRWNLKFCLDNGRWLRMYGTKQTGNVDLKFDFGDMLIERVVFEAGTFGKIVTLYKDKTEPEKHGFKSKPCDQAFREGITVWRYKISGDE